MFLCEVFQLILLHMRMTDEDSPSYILLLLFSLLFPYTACSTADPLYTICEDPLNYTLDSKFESNLRLLLQSLPSNTSLSGFYNTSVGLESLDPDPVYGLALCRGDVTSVDCGNCIQIAIREIVEQCANKKDATIFYEFCQVRYSYDNFFSSMVYAGKYPPWNERQHNISDSKGFTVNLRDLMRSLSSQATTDPSNSMFATGDVSINSTNRVYGLVQCTKDISRDSCGSCLQGAIGDLEGCCSWRQGGIIVSTSCNLRFGLRSFYHENRRKKSKVAIITSVPIFVVLVVLIGSFVYCQRGRKGTHEVEEKSQHTLLHDFGAPTIGDLSSRDMPGGNQMNNQELPLMDFASIKVATDNFSDLNKLGQGGFGIVYKGRLPDGKEIAVKRLSKMSWQGLEEFKNEVILIAKLQHRNLVRLLGYGIEGEEKLLIYEFMPNTSLNVFIFDPARRAQLDWTTRFNIIIGITRGLLYLHEDSRLKIIHRDLKPNNVLLDYEMNAKISDFGMARIFGETQSQANTRRVVGTYGYMAPEYAMEGLFSVKSDVFGFGVILLEIISGKRSSGFYLTEHAQSLLTYAWHLWNEGKGLDFVDPLMIESYPREEVLRCIHIGLLCVQEDAADRPTMSYVLIMLGNELIDLPQPTQPAFSVRRVAIESGQSSSAGIYSVNGVTISSVSPR